MEVKYRYTRAVLDGGKFGLWVARALGVEAKLLKLELTREEARKLGLHPEEAKPKVEFPEGLSNGFGE